ncbi:hypothetical protein D3981_004201 [Escherichia coli]|nr:hypothetical protein [Escherichia coli]
MIEERFHGKALSDIPPEYFDEPFETWTGKLPALVIASTCTVPVNINSKWRLASTFYGGHREEIFCAAVLQLDISQEMADVVRYIADSDFTAEYLGYFESLPEADHRSILLEYSRYLESVGLTCSEVNLKLFSENLYPLDASSENLHRLSFSDNESIPDSGDVNLVMFIIGPSDSQ